VHEQTKQVQDLMTFTKSNVIRDVFLLILFDCDAKGSASFSCRQFANTEQFDSVGAWVIQHLKRVAGVKK